MPKNERPRRSTSVSVTEKDFNKAMLSAPEKCEHCDGDEFIPATVPTLGGGFRLPMCKACGRVSRPTNWPSSKKEGSKTAAQTFDSKYPCLNEKCDSSNYKLTGFTEAMTHYFKTFGNPAPIFTCTKCGEDGAVGNDINRLREMGQELHDQWKGANMSVEKSAATNHKEISSTVGEALADLAEYIHMYEGNDYDSECPECEGTDEDCDVCDGTGEVDSDDVGDIFDTNTIKRLDVNKDSLYNALNAIKSGDFNGRHVGVVRDHVDNLGQYVEEIGPDVNGIPGIKGVTGYGLDELHSMLDGLGNREASVVKTASALNEEPDQSISLVEYLAGDDPICDDCNHAWSLHGGWEDEGEPLCTVNLNSSESNCDCDEFKNSAYENWYSKRKRKSNVKTALENPFDGYGRPFSEDPLNPNVDPAYYGDNPASDTKPYAGPNSYSINTTAPYMPPNSGMENPSQNVGPYSPPGYEEAAMLGSGAEDDSQFVTTAAPYFRYQLPPEAEKYKEEQWECPNCGSLNDAWDRMGTLNGEVFTFNPYCQGEKKCDTCSGKGTVEEYKVRDPKDRRRFVTTDECPDCYKGKQDCNFRRKRKIDFIVESNTQQVKVASFEQWNSETEWFDGTSESIYRRIASAREIQKAADKVTANLIEEQVKVLEKVANEFEDSSLAEYMTSVPGGTVAMEYDNLMDGGLVDPASFISTEAHKYITEVNTYDWEKFASDAPRMWVTAKAQHNPGVLRHEGATREAAIDYVKSKTMVLMDPSVRADIIDNFVSDVEIERRSYVAAAETKADADSERRAEYERQQRARVAAELSELEYADDDTLFPGQTVVGTNDRFDFGDDDGSAMYAEAKKVVEAHANRNWESFCTEGARDWFYSNETGMYRHADTTRIAAKQYVEEETTLVNDPVIKTEIRRAFLASVDFLREEWLEKQASIEEPEEDIDVLSQYYDDETLW